jgi:2-(1,2-epoxy-1,2-dihydrophenyl)acetyl-CoA isomerase
MSDLVLWEVRNGVGHIVLNQPDQGNVISTAMAHALAAVVQQACKADIGAVLISASGKQFCVGGISVSLAKPRALPPLITEMLALLNPTMHALASLPCRSSAPFRVRCGGGGIGSVC